jgi:hypothetical protein
VERAADRLITAFAAVTKNGATQVGPFFYAWKSPEFTALGRRDNSYICFVSGIRQAADTVDLDGSLDSVDPAHAMQGLCVPGEIP